MLARLAALGARRRALLAAGAAWVLAARAALAVPGASLPAIERWLDGAAARLPSPPLTADEAVWAVTAAARRVPGTRCLAWALALRGLLARAGLPCALRIGVRGAGSGHHHHRFVAHAFVEHAGRTLSWGDAEGYRVLRTRAAAS